jgi:methionyl-tRNA formyltransferase
MRIVFLGTPAFAVPTLKKLLSWDKGEVVAVVTQPDRPVGRHLKLQASAVKLLAQSVDIPIFQPDKLSRSPETIEGLRALKPDVLVLAVFGQLLKEPVLSLAPYGVVNLHPSLLPKYRGAAPINWAVLNGDTTTGVTTMLLDEGMDTGDMLLKREVSIDVNDTAADLFQTLSLVGADLMIETLEGLLVGKIVATAQDNTQVVPAPKLTTEMGNIDWSKGSKHVHNLVRGLVPWPGAYSYFDDTRVKVLSTQLQTTDLDFSGHTIPARWAAGLMFTVGGKCYVNCNANTMDLLELTEVQPQNRPRMPAYSWVNGFRIKDATALGTFSSIAN